jgi:hypothetical protein
MDPEVSLNNFMLTHPKYWASTHLRLLILKFPVSIGTDRDCKDCIIVQFHGKNQILE